MTSPTDARAEPPELQPLPPQAADAPPPVTQQTWIALATMALAVALALGALGIPGDAGYAGVGPNFLPWVVSGVLLLCGSLLLMQSRRGGWSDVDPPSGARQGDWRALAWVVAGVLANAGLITTIGFVLSCTLCYVLGVRGLRWAEGRRASGLRQLLLDAFVGACIAAPVYWLFGKLLSITLPGLTTTGWI